MLPWGDRFEDFHDKVGISLEAFRDELTGTWLFNYVEALQSAGLQPVLYFFSARIGEPVRFPHRHTGAPIRVLPTPWLHRKLQAVRDRLRIRSPLFSSVRSYVATPWRALARELRRDGCTAILCQEYEYPRFDEAVMLGHALKIPVFATYQGGNRPGSALERLVRPSAIRRATGLVIASRAEARRVQSTYGLPIDRIAVIPNAFDVRRWRPVDRDAARSAVGIPVSAPVVVWHGRVEIHSKGLDVLLEAWEQVWASQPDLRPLLLVVGSGQDRDALRRRLVRLPPDAVRWENRWIYDRQLLWQYLSAADIAVLASRHEGFAVAVVEAMACGLPVVATDVSGVAEALGEDPAGVIVPPEDVAGLAAAVRRLLRDPSLRREMGLRARRRAEEHFSLEAVGDRLRAFMEDRGAVRGPGRRQSPSRCSTDHGLRGPRRSSPGPGTTGNGEA
ncbi:MAG: glycosyltransferase family 4 protein [Actinomycetota bacterium]|nr:glycosyltransferase family 4 protein [Actinomycetota bacterium]